LYVDRADLTGLSYPLTAKANCNVSLRIRQFTVTCREIQFNTSFPYDLTIISKAHLCALTMPLRSICQAVINAIHSIPEMAHRNK